MIHDWMIMEGYKLEQSKADTPHSLFTSDR